MSQWEGMKRKALRSLFFYLLLEVNRLSAASERVERDSLRPAGGSAEIFRQLELNPLSPETLSLALRLSQTRSN